MIELTTALGRMIPCDAVIRATNYNYLTIHTKALSRVEVDTIFDDPAQTAELTAVEKIGALDENGDLLEAVGETKVYRGWTVLDAVQRSPLFDDPAELMIWLQRPEEED